MQLIYLFFTPHHIKFWAPSLSPSEGQMPHSGGISGALEALPNFLDSLPSWGETGTGKVVAIFDQGLCSYRYFQLPPLKAAKVKKILPFELEDELISAVEDVIYDVKIQKFQAGKPTDAGVYLFEREALQHVQQLLTNSGLELSQATSGLCLLDQLVTGRSKNAEGLHLFFDGNQAFLLLYQGGFLVQSSKIEAQSTSNQLLKSINQRLKACFLELGESTPLELYGHGEMLLEVNEKKEVAFRDPKVEPDIPFLFPDLYQVPLQKGATINFTKPEPKGIKDFSKSLWKFKEVAILLAIWFAVYLGSVGYQLYKQSGELAALEKTHRAVAAKYVQGVPATRALRVLKKRFKEQTANTDNSKTFWAGKYPVSSLLLKVSESFKGVEGFKMTHFTLNQQGLNIKGLVPGLKELDQVKGLIGDLFTDARYKTRFSQKPGPEGSSIFNLSVERIR